MNIAQGGTLQQGELERARAQLREMERRAREAAAGEAAARRDCQRLIDGGPISQSTVQALESERDAEMTRRKKAEAEIDRLTRSWRLASGPVGDMANTPAAVAFDTAEAELMRTELLMKEVDKVRSVRGPQRH